MVVFTLSYGPVLDRMQKGEVAKVSFATFQIEFAREEFAKAVQAGPKEGPPPHEFSFYAERIQREAEKLSGARALWISDHNPKEYFAERRALASLGISFDLAKNTDEAQDLFGEADRLNSPYDLIISDMARDPKIDPVAAPCYPFPGSPKEAGCWSLQVAVGRYQSRPIPFIFYSLDGDRLGTPSGAFGATDRIDRLIPLVLDAVERGASRARVNCSPSRRLLSR